MQSLPIIVREATCLPEAVNRTKEFQCDDIFALDTSASLRIIQKAAFTKMISNKRLHRHLRVESNKNGSLA